MTSNGIPGARRHKTDYLDTIKVLVGEEELEFTIHEDVIVNSSKFFRAACNNGFKETKERIVRLPSLSIETFKAYIHWIYTGEFSLMTTEEAKKDVDGRERMLATVDLYSAADSLDDRRLRDAAIDFLIELINTLNYYPGYKIVSEAYDVTTAGSLLRKALVDEYSTMDGSDAEWVHKVSAELPQEFLADVLYAKMVSTKKSNEGEKKDICRYHEHDDDLPKCATSIHKG